jgi:signal transduction histidine kinase
MPLCARGSEAPGAHEMLSNTPRQAITSRTPILVQAGEAGGGAPMTSVNRSQICVPLIDGEAVFGVLTIFGEPAQVLGDSDLRMLTLIGQNLSLAVARAQLIADLEAARDQALHASRAKTQFLTMMSHELRTPLNVILGGTELLQATIVRSDQLELARMTVEAGENLLDIINDVLDLARIEAGKVELVQEDCLIDQIARSVFRMLEAQAVVKGLQMLYHNDTPDLLVHCDPKRARQILLNLLANAIKFTENGSISLSVTQEDACARVTVTDTGSGIRAADLARLFRPFTQVDSSSSRRYGGTGLGLAISRQLVELMGGEIGVTSEPGIGSAFWFTLRAAPAGDRIIPQSP